MFYFMCKVVLSALIIVVVSEVAKRYSVLAGLIGSLPLTSYLAMVWLYADERSPQKVADLSMSIFWYVLPSLSLLLALPILLKRLHFAPALILSTLIMFACYGLMTWLLARAGIKF